jgi:hypothetical protein
MPSLSTRKLLSRATRKTIENYGRKNCLYLKIITYDQAAFEAMKDSPTEVFFVIKNEGGILWDEMFLTYLQVELKSGKLMVIFLDLYLGHYCCSEPDFPLRKANGIRVESISVKRVQKAQYSGHLRVR